MGACEGDASTLVTRVRATATFWGHASLVMLREVKQGGLDYRAMSLVYTSLLALVPLLAVSFSVMKAFGGESHLEPLLLELLAPLGDNAEAVSNRILDSVKRLRVGLLGFLGFAFLFYTSVALLEKIEESFNHIWRTKASRSFLRRFSDYLSFTLVGPLLLVSLFGGVTGLIEGRPNARVFRGLFDPLQHGIHVLLPYIFVVAAFAFLYRYVPNARVSGRAALFGGALAGLAWKAAGWLFSGFIASSAQYHAVYSSFAILVLFMIWLYVSWLIVLLGVQASFYCQHPRYLRLRTTHPRLGPRSFERIGLTLMWLVARRFLEGGAPWTAEALSDALDLPEDCVDDLLEVLREAGLVMITGDDERRFVPGRDLSTIGLGELLQVLRTGHDETVLNSEAAFDPKPVDAFLLGLDSAVRTYAGDLSLRELVATELPEGKQF